ncbi:MAG: DJ-1/PfpI family protein [Caldilineales bacterium]
MPEKRDRCFVLWADRFDEAAAALFVTEFRKAGLKTNLVQVTGQHTTGANGLALVPDMAIDDARALASRAACVVVPCDTAAVRQTSSDPRVAAFLSEALASGVELIIGERAIELAPWNGSLAQATVRSYSAEQSVQRFARRIAHRLAKDQSRSRRRKLQVSLNRL